MEFRRIYCFLAPRELVFFFMFILSYLPRIALFISTAFLTCVLLLTHPNPSFLILRLKSAVGSSVESLRVGDIESFTCSFGLFVSIDMG